MPTLPSYVKTGTVLGKSYIVSTDTAGDVDADPDAIYPVGAELLFTPSLPRNQRNLSFGNDVVYLQDWTSTINSTGDPVTADGGPLKLVANIGQTQNDQVWYWVCKVKINGVWQKEFRFDVTADTNNYIGHQQPVPGASPSSAVVRGADGAGAPPSGTPDNYVAVSVGSTTTWMAPAVARSALGLGSAATHPASDFDAAGAATTAASAAQSAAIAAAATAADTKIAAQHVTDNGIYARVISTAATKTGAYTAAANQIVPADATSAAFAVTLPTAPADQTRVTVKKLDTSANAVTVATGGSDVFNKPGGSTTVNLALTNQAVTVQYNATLAVWTVIGDDLPLSGLDGRYPSIPATVLGWAVAGAYTLTSATRDANAAITTATVAWPDGQPGTFTTDTASTAFPGAIDGYHVTYGSPAVHTYTQPTMTRDASTGAVTAQPALVVS